MSSAVAYGSFVKYGIDIFRTATYLQWGNSDRLIGACVMCNPGIAVLEARGLYIHGPVNEGREFTDVLRNDKTLLQLAKIVEGLYKDEKLEGILYVYNLFSLLDAPGELFEGTMKNVHVHKDIIFRGITDFLKYSSKFPWLIIAWGYDNRPGVYHEKMRWLEFIKNNEVPFVGIRAVEYPGYIHPLLPGEWSQQKYIDDILKQFKDKSISLKSRENERKPDTREMKETKGSMFGHLRKMVRKHNLFDFIDEENEGKNGTEEKPINNKVKVPEEAASKDNSKSFMEQYKTSQLPVDIIALSDEKTKEQLLKDNIRLFDNKEYYKILGNCHKALEMDDKYLPIYIQKSTALEAINDAEGAVRNLGEVLVKTKDMTLQNLYDAKVAEYRGEYDKAVHSYEEAIKIISCSDDGNIKNDEAMVYVYNSFGKLLLKLRRYAEALEYFDKVLVIRHMKETSENKEKALNFVEVTQMLTEGDVQKKDEGNDALDIGAEKALEEVAAEAVDSEDKIENYVEVKVEEKIEESTDVVPGEENTKSDNWQHIKDELDSLIGLNNVKRELYSIINYLDYERKRSKLLNLSEENLSYHFLFTGNPGTGKTTVARLLGEMLVKAGVLSKGHVVEVDRSKLVGQYVGQTAVLTRKAIESAKDGILFIDEAYSLNRSDNPNDYGIEAIDTLVKAMEDYRGKFVVILAGYTKELNKLMNLNPGLKSRINVQIQFDNYNDEELLQIAKKIAREKHYELDAGAEEAFNEKISRLKVDDSFANGRTVRNIIEDAIREKAFRIGTSNVSEEELKRLSAVDFGNGPDEKTGEGIESILDELNELIGLKEVKGAVKGIVDYLQLQCKRKEMGLKNEDIAANMIFTGNPGTGKTTVARLFGRLFRELGILKKGQLVEVTREDLVGEYIGQTSSKALEKIKEAYGGILFIDEAYTLAQGGENDFGKEALAVLIKEMEDNRDKLMVIMAGYSSEMENLLNLNPGLKSRIGFSIEFPDYTPEELLQIFKGYCRNNDYMLSRAAEKVLMDKLQEMYSQRDKSFGNARLARQFFEKVKMKQANRVMEGQLQGENTNGLMTITYVDIMGIDT